MSFTESPKVAGQKRKRTGEDKKSKSKASKPNGTESVDVDRLEREILESRKNYNNIVKLQAIAFPKNGISDSQGAALLALCRTFSHLLAEGSLTKTKTTKDSERVVMQWLEERYREFSKSLTSEARNGDSAAQPIITTLVMQLVKNEVNALGDEVWQVGLFAKLMREFLGHGESCQVPRASFVKKYFAKYDDVRFYTLQLLPYVLSRWSPHSQDFNL
jgi:U3 small nucleolar RNA-associated protein 19